MTDNKPLGEWTLNEVKEECSRIKYACDACFFYREVWGGCMFDGTPSEDWDLTDTPQFTEDEQAALRVLKSAGIGTVEREDNARERIIIWRDSPKYTVAYLPKELFPSIKRGQSVEL